MYVRMCVCMGVWCVCLCAYKIICFCSHNSTIIFIETECQRFPCKICKIVVLAFIV